MKRIGVFAKYFPGGGKMKKIKKILPCLVVVMIFSAGTALGAGFKLPEQGAKAMGMSMAWTAQADDPSAIYYNPAGITQLTGHQILLGGTLIFAKGSEFNGTITVPPPVSLTLPIAEKGKDQEFFAPVAYYTYGASEKVFLGIGINAPFGLARTYSPNFAPPSTTGNIGLNVQHAHLKTVVINPTIAYKLSDFVSFGFGIDYMHASAEFDRTLPLPTGTTKFHLDGDGDDWSWNAGLLITPGKFRFGFSFRNGYSVEIEGDAIVAGTGLSSGGRTTIEMADIFNMAVAYQTEKFTIEFDYDYTNWSDFQNLDIRLDSNLGPIIPAFIPQPKNWKDVAAYRLGGRYNFSEFCYASAGVFYDENPVPEETHGSELPDADRKGFSLGAGFAIKKIGVDLSYIFFDYRDRNVSAPPNGNGYNGTWTQEAHLVALNLSYAF